MRCQKEGFWDRWLEGRRPDRARDFRLGKGSKRRISEISSLGSLERRVVEGGEKVYVIVGEGSRPRFG